MLQVLVTCIILFITAFLWRLFIVFYWRPRALLAHLNKQGIYGPQPKLIGGNLTEILGMRTAVKDHDMEAFTHNVVERILPDHVYMSQKFGKRHVIWWGMEPRITFTELELIREILSTKPTQFWKSKAQMESTRIIVGGGLFAISGDEWTRHRRVIAPAFYLEKLKGMISVMASSTSTMLDQWETMAQQEKEVEICGEMSRVTSDILSRTVFGSSYEAGQKVFEILRKKLPLQAFKFASLAWIPGSRYLPLPPILKLKQLHKEMETTIKAIIDQRRKFVEQSKGARSYGNDLLGLMLKEGEGDSSFTYNDVIDECKTFYIAGSETIARLVSWCLMLLAGHPEWQERARAEVLETCGDDDTPDGDTLNKLKLVGMILYEALRLYPSAAAIDRACLEDTWVKDVFVPKGVTINIPIIAIHHDKELWGEDADEFNPERFKDGIKGACKHPNAYMPFSFGPRVCIGQTFALLQARVILALILRRFLFRFSQNYRHNPAPADLGFKPAFGIQLMLTKI